jgi:hypothetical protein
LTLDGFFGRAYHRRRYNCAHFAIEIWEYLHRRPVVASMYGFLLPGEVSRGLGHAEGVRVLTAPCDSCFVLMRSAVLPPHVGVFYRDKIIHLAGNYKVQYLRPELVTMGYTRIRFFTC